MMLALSMNPIPIGFISSSEFRGMGRDDKCGDRPVAALHQEGFRLQRRL
jgi:hypothetical protein